MVDNAFGQSVRQIAVMDRRSCIVQRRRIGADRCALVGGIGHGNIAGRRVAQCIADPETDQFRANVLDARPKRNFRNRIYFSYNFYFLLT